MTTTRETSALAFLRQIPFLGTLPHSDLAELAMLCQSEQIQRNSPIYHKGDVSSHLFLLLRGQ